MPAKPFKAVVKYEAREPNQFGKINAVFTPVGEKARAAMEKAGIDVIRVNATPDTEKARLLQALKRGQEVMLFKAGTYEGKPYFDLLDMPAGGDGSDREAPALARAFDVEAETSRIAALYLAIKEKTQASDEACTSMACTLYIRGRS